MSLLSTIKGKLILFSLGISFIPITIITTIHYISSSKTLKHQVVSELTAIAESKKLHILTYMEAKRGRAVDFSSDGYIRDKLEKSAAHESFALREAISLNRHLLKNKISLDQSIIAILVLDKHGKVFSSTNETLIGKDMSNQEVFTRLANTNSNNFYITHPHYSPCLERNCILVSVILTSRRNGKTIGAIAIAYNLDTLNEMMTNRAGMGKTGEVYLVNKDKLMITRSRFLNNEPFTLMVDTEPTRKVVNDGKEMTGIYPDYRNVPVFGVSSYLPEYGLTLLAEIDKEEAFAPIKALRIAALIVGGVGTITVTSIGIIFALSIAAPIIRLKHATERFAAGELNYKVKVTCKNEIGDLANSFNSMTEKLVCEMTEHRRAENAALESEAKFRAISSSAQEAIIMVDNGEDISYWNESAEKMFGYSQEEAIGEKLHTLIIPDRFREGHLHGFKRFRESGKGAIIGKIIEVDAVNKKGIEFSIELSLAAVKLKERWNAIGIIRDITERKRMQDDLRNAHAHNEQLIASIPSILIYIDEDGKVIQWNTMAEATFGIPAEKAMGRPFSESGIQWEDNEMVKQILDCQNMTQQLRIDDVRFKNPDGRVGFLGITINPVKGESGKHSGLLIVGRDITQRKLLESQLVQAQKLESIGQLAAGIAHEINTPTQYVGDNTRFLKDTFSDFCKLIDKFRELHTACGNGGATDNLIREIDLAEKETDVEYLVEEIPKAILQSQEGIERITKIVRAMKDFSHPGIDEKSPIDINRAIESTVTVARNEWKYVADMETDYDASLPLIPCFPGEFNQAILNIIINAAHAIADVVGDGSKRKGIITIGTRRVGEWAEIRIQDTGTGIPEAIRSKIFDPFFTTKEVGKGTGQGLSIVHAIVVEKHRGTITFETEAGKGTTFIVRIPMGND